MNLGTVIGSKHAVKLTRKKIFIIAAILLIAIAVIGINYFKPKTQNGPALQQTIAVARKGDISVFVEGSGPISSSEKFTLTSNVSGTLTNIYFEDGDKLAAIVPIATSNAENVSFLVCIKKSSFTGRGLLPLASSIV
jgi:multidrug efflux pump subunit AcrA (membrane-fusion protein)